jgi:hypothetical protein
MRCSGCWRRKTWGGPRFFCVRLASSFAHSSHRYLAARRLSFLCGFRPSCARLQIIAIIQVTAEHRAPSWTGGVNDMHTNCTTIHVAKSPARQQGARQKEGRGTDPTRRPTRRIRTRGLRLTPGNPAPRLSSIAVNQAPLPGEVRLRSPPGTGGAKEMPTRPSRAAEIDHAELSDSDPGGAPMVGQQ